ncbi:MAG: M48 family metalloprotease [Armatimonadota bacterium]
MRPAAIILLLLTVLLAIPSGLRAAPADDAEISLGRQGAAEVEARFRVVRDPAVQERLTKIGTTIAAVTERPRLPYTFKAVELDQVNAVAFPGGFVYVTTGLLGFVRSDHELAGVIAHEIAHAAHSHGLEMQRRANRATLITILIAVLTGDARLAAGAQIVGGGLLAGYSRDLERDADLTAIAYLTKTPYSPVGVLTLLERMHRMEQFSPRPDHGALADHPRTAERVQYVLDDLRARRIPINRRVPANYLVLAVREGSEGGAAFAEILVNGRPIIRLGDVPRIKEAADLLDRLFDADLEPYEVMARETDGGWGLFTRGWPLVRLSAADVPAGVGSVRELAFVLQARLRAAIDEDIRRRRLQG